MSRTFRRYVDTYYRNARHCKRLVAEKSRHDGEMTAGNGFEGIEARQVCKLAIDSLQISYQFLDFGEFRLAGNDEIHIPSPEHIMDIRLSALRFMRDHKCSYRSFISAVYGRPGLYDRKESLEKDILFEISSL